MLGDADPKEDSIVALSLCSYKLSLNRKYEFFVKKLKKFCKFLKIMINIIISEMPLLQILIISSQDEQGSNPRDKDQFLRWIEILKKKKKCKLCHLA